MSSIVYLIAIRIAKVYVAMGISETFSGRTLYSFSQMDLYVKLSALTVYKELS